MKEGKGMVKGRQGERKVELMKSTIRRHNKRTKETKERA